jgi:uncharacterized membrane protein YbhN (UPF0104 family)
MKDLRQASRVISVLIAVAAFGASVWYVTITFQWGDAWHIATAASPLWLGAAALTIPAYWGLRTVRWHWLLQELGVSIRPGQLYVCVATAVGLATVTPFQSGEALKVEFLTSRGRMGRLAGYSSFVVERVADLAVVVALAGAAFLLGPNLGLSRGGVLAGVVGLLLAIVASVLLVWKFRVRGRIGRFQSHLEACVPSLKALTLLFATTLAGWLVTGVGWYASLRSVGIDIGYVNIVALMCILTVIGILSFVPGSLGVGEAGASLFLLRLGQSAPESQAGALVLRFYGIMIVLLAIMHLSVWRWWRPKTDRPGEEAATHPIAPNAVEDLTGRRFREG